MSRRGPVGVGIIGAGTISQTYCENLTAFPDVEVLAIGDLFPDAAQAKAAEHGIATSGGVDAVLDHPEVELVVNLTIPAAHAEVATQAIEAGKHVWNEKPLTLDRDSGQALLAAAKAAGVRVGCSPDTFLGAGLQTTQRLIDAGEIGTPLTALTLMQSPGPESWHPNPAFLFAEGAGPLFDIGPYYLTAMVQFFGPVSRVSAIGSTARRQRTIGSGPKAGEQFNVAVPTHMSAMLEFVSGGSSQHIWSFDSGVRRVLFEINGTEATLGVPDPNNFASEINIVRPGSEDWELLADPAELSSRGTGALEMARAIRADQPHRGSAELALHVLDVMQSISEAATSGQPVSVRTSVERPAALPEHWDPHARTL